MLLLLLIVGFPMNVAKLTYSDEQIELLVCRIFQKTPIYQKQMLDRKSNCLSSVKIFGEVVCLLDRYNNVRKKPIECYKF